MPYTITPIEITAINECPHCGTETEFISSSDAHALNEWLVDNSARLWKMQRQATQKLVTASPGSTAETMKSRTVICWVEAVMGLVLARQALYFSSSTMILPIRPSRLVTTVLAICKLQQRGVGYSLIASRKFARLNN